MILTRIMSWTRSPSPGAVFTVHNAAIVLQLNMRGDNELPGSQDQPHIHPRAICQCRIIIQLGTHQTLLAPAPLHLNNHRMHWTINKYCRVMIVMSASDQNAGRSKKNIIVMLYFSNISMIIHSLMSLTVL